MALKRFIRYYSFESHETIVVLDADLSPEMKEAFFRRQLASLRRASWRLVIGVILSLQSLNDFRLT